MMSCIISSFPTNLLASTVALQALPSPSSYWGALILKASLLLMYDRSGDSGLVPSLWERGKSVICISDAEFEHQKRNLKSLTILLYQLDCRYTWNHIVVIWDWISGSSWGSPWVQSGMFSRRSWVYSVNLGSENILPALFTSTAWHDLWTDLRQRCSSKYPMAPTALSHKPTPRGVQL